MYFNQGELFYWWGKIKGLCITGEETFIPLIWAG